MAVAAAAQTGRVTGWVSGPDGEGLGGVEVVAVESGDSTLTVPDGTFRLELPAGSQLLRFQAGDRIHEQSVEVPLAVTATVEVTLDWDLPLEDRSLVFGVSRGWERRGDAFLDASVVGSETTDSRATLGLVPELFESEASVGTEQATLHGFVLSTRGLGGYSTPRMAYRRDGRDLAGPFFGTPYWPSIVFPLEDLVHAEVVRGPSSSVYGADAEHGVLNLVTRSSADSGGLVRLTGGEESTFGGDLRWAGTIVEGWSAEVLGAARRSDGFSTSRTAGPPCIAVFPVPPVCRALEEVPLDPDDEEIFTGSIRVDHPTASGGVLTAETGGSDVSGPVTLTSIGRLQATDTRSYWSRVGYWGDRWRVWGTWDTREADELRALSTGQDLMLDEERFRFVAETSQSFFGDRLRIDAGAAHRDEEVDSLDASGPIRPSLLNPLNQQTVLFEGVEEDRDGVWADGAWFAGDRLRMEAGVRYDDGSLFDPQWSPRAGVVWSPNPSHVLRAAWGRSYRAPTLSERFLSFDAAEPLNLSALEHEFCARHAVPCGFDLDFVAGEDPLKDTTADTRILAAGNADLELEETDTAEIGYRARLGHHGLLTAGYHYSEHENVISSLLPQLGTALGRLNPAFGPYQPPRSPLPGGAVPELPPDVEADLLARLRAVLGPLFPFLTNAIDGTPVLVVSSFANLGEAETQGADLAFRWSSPRGWGWSLSYSWLDFELGDAISGFPDALRANAPEHRAAGELSYTGSRWDAAVVYRWVDDFRWSSGPFRGPVDSYATVDLFANVGLGSHWSLGLAVTNLTDEEQPQTFGGDVLGRRALGSVTLRW